MFVPFWLILLPIRIHTMLVLKFGGATWTRTRKEGLKVLYDNHFIITPLLRTEASL